MATWPAGIYTPLVRGTNLDDTVTHTDIHDGDVAEIVAIQTSLGVGVKGSEASVAARLNTLDDLTVPLGAVCLVATSTGNTLTSGASATISWETETYDPQGWFSGGAPTLITPDIAGYYEVSVAGNVAADPDGDYSLFQIRVQKSTVDFFAYTARPSAATSSGAQFFGSTPLVSMNGSTDTFRIVAAQTNTDSDSRTFTGYFSVKLVVAT
jgi:hypothetical protein